MRRYRLIVEVYEDDKLIRRMEESRNQLDSDYCDGEKTIGLLLSFVPAWSAADAIGGDGLATIAYMCHYLPMDSDDDVRKFKVIGDAYDKWGASHEFAGCVDVRIDSSRLECNEVTCDHAPESDI